MSRNKLKDGFIRPGVKEETHKINDKITAKQVRLIGENVHNGVYSLFDAKKIAEAQGLDLVVISEQEIPICKVIDYSKYVYDLKKKQRDQKPKKIQTKEIGFSANISEHDYNFKKKHVQSFLEEGNKVKCIITFHGRQIAYKDQGEILLLKLATELAEYGKVELMPQLEGKKMQLILAPKKK